MFKRIDHVEIVMDQVERAVEFYTEVLGFTVRSQDRILGLPLGVPMGLVYLDLGATTVELISYEGASADPARRTEHLGYRMMALEVDDMQATVQSLRTKRGRDRLGAQSSREVRRGRDLRSQRLPHRAQAVVRVGDRG